MALTNTTKRVVLFVKNQKFSQERVFPYCTSVVESGDPNPADFLLACTTRGVCDAYQNVILKIHRLSTNSTKQLITDVGKSALKIDRHEQLKKQKILHRKWSYFRLGAISPEARMIPFIHVVRS